MSSVSGLALDFGHGLDCPPIPVIGIFLQKTNSSFHIDFLISMLTSAYQSKFVDRDDRFKKNLLRHYSEISFPNFIDSVLNDFKRKCK